MTVLPSKEGSTEHGLKWINRKQALLAYTGSIKIKIKVSIETGNNNPAFFLIA